MSHREMKTAANSPPALGYISAQLRDFGAVNEAAAMMERALDIQPSHTSCALAYVHTLHVSICELRSSNTLELVLK